MIRKKNDVAESSSYPLLLESVKEKIKTAQLKAALAVNSEFVSLYWEIGHMLSAKMEQKGWGSNLYGFYNFASSACKNSLWHNILLLEKLDNLEERIWYAQQTIVNGWNRC